MNFYPGKELQLKLSELLTSEFADYFVEHNLTVALELTRKHILKLAEDNPELVPYPRLSHKLICNLFYNELTGIITIKFLLEPNNHTIEIRQYLAKELRQRAIVFSGEENNLRVIKSWLGINYIGTSEFDNKLVGLCIQGPQGELMLELGDYIVEDPSGGFSSMKEKEFKEAFDEIKVQ